MGEALPLYTFILALIAALSAALSPVIMSLITERNRAKGAEEAAKLSAAKLAAEWARQDVVADLLKRSTAAQAVVAVDQGQKLDQIHLLVNSNMTAEMQKGLESHKALLALLVRLAPKETARIKALEAQIVELEAQLRERAAAAIAAATATAAAAIAATAAATAAAPAPVAPLPPPVFAEPPPATNTAQTFKVEKIKEK